MPIALRSPAAVLSACVLLAAALLLTPTTGYGAEEDLTPRVTIETVNPWTRLDLNNDPRHFQFAIVSDRTGGHRPGVFADAVGKLNLLQPEFVLTVGDMIEGYTEEQKVLDAQWAEFNEFVEALEMPFFYVPGNHDISNAAMTADWNRRRGRSYYHFVYQDVLFLCLNSEDPPPSHISAQQLAYVERALNENPDVRWTLVFIHKPLWTRDDDSGWDRVEALLRDRRHTVFAGHNHTYVKYQRHDANYFVLATTGGGSQLRGHLFGEFDHVVWVTMTDAGPRVANLMLEGIWDENIRTPETAELIGRLISGSGIRAEPIFVEKRKFKRGTTRLRLTNDADVPMRITGAFADNTTLRVTPQRIDITVPPNSVELVDLKLEARKRGARVDELEPLRLDWNTTVELGAGEPLVLDGQSTVMVERHFECRGGRAKTVDGDLSDWKSLPLACVQPAQIRGNVESWEGPQDLSFRFGTEYDDEYLYIGIEVTDDHRVLHPDKSPWAQDGIEVRLDARAESLRADNQGRGERSEFALIAMSPGATAEEMNWYQRGDADSMGVKAVSLLTPTGHNTEIAVPLAWLEKMQGQAWDGFRLTIAVDDFDDPEGPLAQVWWRPRWGSDQDFAGSGMFRKR